MRPLLRAHIVNYADDCVMGSWDHSVDFLVVGSGAAGLTAALRAHDLGGEVLVVEKASLFGGNTAISGGVIWVPDNPSMRAAGIADSLEEGLCYLEAITDSSTTKEKLRAYLETAPRMIEYLAAHSHVRFECLPHYPDYYPELAGGKPGGRSCEPAFVDALKLGPEWFRMRALSHERLILGGRLTIKATEARNLLAGGWATIGFMLRALLQYYMDFPARLRRFPRARWLSLGGALAGGLRCSLMERGVPLWLDTPVVELVVEDGCVTGALVERDGKPLRIQARRGVMLGTGGFEHSEALRAQYGPAPSSTQWTGGCDSNTGDMLAIGQAVGGSVDLMDEAWWCPSMRVESSSDPVRVVIFENHLPGSLIVNRQGRRFMNEAAPYNDIGKDIYAAHSEHSPAIPAFLIFDALYRKRYPCGPMRPGYATPDRALPKSLEGSFFEKADTLDALATKLGVDSDGLVDTVRRFNAYALEGKDPEFGRGDSLQDRYYSVAEDLPNPNLAPIEKPPFYAVKIYPGDLGTKGGFRTDTQARVLDAGDAPIPGLYAAGNCSAVVMGRTYPGAGGTIGPAMAFGFLAAEHALEKHATG